MSTPEGIEVEFDHADQFDVLQMRCRLSGEDFSVYFTSLWCPFSDYVRFLEAIAKGEMSCRFEWDPEGSYGCMRWEQNDPDTGFLTVEWRDQEDTFDHRILLNTRQAVGAFYSAFRRFVESPDYDPLRYESIGAETAFSMVMSDASTEALACLLVELNAKDADALIQTLCRVIGKRIAGESRLCQPLAYYREAVKAGVPATEFSRTWIPGDWDAMSREQRLNEVENVIYKGGTPSWYGANLRQLKSPCLDQWLVSSSGSRKTRTGVRS
jgi:hypothetical protein